MEAKIPTFAKTARMGAQQFKTLRVRCHKVKGKRRRSLISAIAEIFRIEVRSGCPTLCDFSKGGGLDSAAIRNWRMEAKIPTFAKTARMGHPPVQTPRGSMSQG